MKDKKKAFRLARSIAGLLVLLAALAAICAILVPHEMQRAASKPTEGRTEVPITIESEASGSIEVSGIDWGYWQLVNPDIVGWITIPDTPIDYPIVQAHPDHPTYYLDYDAHGSYNLYGCPYVDSSCTMDSQNVIVFAHNMGYYDDSMFTTLTYYLGQGYLDSHTEVIIQTPDAVKVLTVRAAEEVSPYGYEKQVAFDTDEEFRSFYLGIWGNAPARSAEAEADEIAQLFTLVTCDRGGSTRVVVYVG